MKLLKNIFYGLIFPTRFHNDYEKCVSFIIIIIIRNKRHSRVVQLHLSIFEKTRNTREYTYI